MTSNMTDAVLTGEQTSSISRSAEPQLASLRTWLGDDARNEEVVPEEGKGGAGLPLPPDVLDLPLGVLDLSLLLHWHAHPAPHQPNCRVAPAESDDALLSNWVIEEVSEPTSGQASIQKRE